jgi:hypothetical protein
MGEGRLWRPRVAKYLPLSVLPEGDLTIEASFLGKY